MFARPLPRLPFSEKDHPQVFPSVVRHADTGHGNEIRATKSLTICKATLG